MSMATPVMEGPVRLPMPQRTPMEILAVTSSLPRKRWPSMVRTSVYMPVNQAAPDKQQDPEQMAHTDNVR